MSSLDVPRSAASALLLARLAAERGLLDPLTGTGLTLTQLTEPGREVTGRQELEVIRNLLGAGLGLALEAGTRYHLTTYGIWGFALASSPTVRSALEVGSQFVDLSFAFCRLAVEQDADELRLVLDDSELPEDVRDFVLTRDMAGLRTVAAELVPGGLALRRVAFRLTEPVPGARAVFGREPEWGAACTGAALDAVVLDLPLAQADELTAAMTERQCRELLAARRARTGLAGQVRDLQVRRPGDIAALEAVAAALLLSSRTLRRRLAEEGTSYRALVDEVRETLALELLATGSLSVEQVARRLGYAETASFTHAFTRWRGQSPRAFARGRR